MPSAQLSSIVGEIMLESVPEQPVQSNEGKVSCSLKQWDSEPNTGR